MISLTVILTCYNEGSLLNEALYSLYNQTDNEFNIIVVNDCSPDETTNLICKNITINDGINVIWNKTNLGLSGARNIAFENMRSDVAICLDGDDTLPWDAIANIRSMFNLNPEADFIFGDYIIRYIESGYSVRIDCSDIADKNGIVSPQHLANNWKLLGTTPCKKRLWQTLGGYSMEFSNTCQDVDFWQRAILSGARGLYCSSIIYNWNMSIKGMNNTKAHLEDLLLCYYKNIDFIIKYSKHSKDGFSISLKHKDYQKIKEWALSRIKKGEFTFLAILFSICPQALSPILCNLYGFVKLNWSKIKSK